LHCGVGAENSLLSAQNSLLGRVGNSVRKPREMQRKLLPKNGPERHFSRKFPANSLQAGN
jgi:hypothetical protein